VTRPLLRTALTALALAACTQPAPPIQPPAATPPPADLPPWPSPEAAGLDPAALRRLVEGAADSGADALVVLKDGRLVLEEHFGTPDRPIEAMSATKSFVSLAVGMLRDEGKIASLDQPVADFFPEWREGRKQRVTLRHLLNHTSGLRRPPSGPWPGEEGTDLVRLALAADLEAEPGTAFAYNNMAVDLLAGVVRKASGQRIDAYLRERLFAPLGITDWSWGEDWARNARGSHGLHIRAADLARVGDMLAAGGTWRGRRLVSEGWIRESTLAPGQALEPGCGLLWWLTGGQVATAPLIDDAGLARLRAAGAEPKLLARLATLRGKVPAGRDEAAALLREALGPEGVERWVREVFARGAAPVWRRLSPPTGFEARGYRGQLLRVVPGQRLVVACMHRVTKKGDPSFDLERLEFPAFGALVDGLAPAPR